MYNDEFNNDTQENTTETEMNSQAGGTQQGSQPQAEGQENSFQEDNRETAGHDTSNVNQNPYYNSNENNNTIQNDIYNQYSQGMNGQPANGGDNGNHKKSFKKVIAGVALAASITVVAGAGFYTVNNIAQNFAQSTKDSIKSDDSSNDEESKDTAATASTVDTTSTEDTATDDSVAQVVENVMPAIVSINTTATESVTDYFGRTYTQDVESAGSGIIIGQNSKEVLIVTNNHVISGANSDGVQVSFCDDEVVSATVKGTDSSNDLAVISVAFSDIKDSTKKEIKVASLGDSDSTKVGETAIAIGNALGYGQSVTVGHISALNRELAVEDSSMTLMQTDAAINPGNSGGALLNAKGEVIGINSAKTATTEVEGMGYAIPISDALPIIEDLMNGTSNAEGDSAYLGIIGENITSAYAQRFNMPQGVYVTEVSEGSPAADAGFVAGMIIVEFDGQEIETKDDLTNVLSDAKAGDSVTAVVYVNQNGSYVKQQVSVTLGKKSDYEDSSSSGSNSDSGSSDSGSSDSGSNGSGSSGSGNSDSGNGYGYNDGSDGYSDGSDSSNGYGFNFGN